jgi:histone-lysine N-methyltransferase SETMAR
MQLTREEKRLLMLHEFKLSSKPNASETARRINKAWGEGAVGERTVQERFKEFKAGNESLTHAQGAGRPREVDRQAVLNSIEAAPSLTTRMLAEEFECAQSTIVEILKELGKVWKKTRWVPHELTDAQKIKRVNCAQVLLDRQNETPFLANRLITGDEKWISYKNPRKIFDQPNKISYKKSLFKAVIKLIDKLIFLVKSVIRNHLLEL